MLSRMRDTLVSPAPGVFLWLPVAFGTGVAVYFALPAEPGRGFIVLTLLLALVPAAAAALPRERARAPALLLLALFAGFLDASLRANLVGAPVLAEPFRGAVEGRIAGISRSASNAPRVLLEDVTLQGLAAGRTPERVRVTLLGWIAPGALSAGQRVTAVVNLSPPGAPVEPGGFDFRRMAWFQRLGAVGYTRHPLIVSGPVARDKLDTRVLALRLHGSRTIRQKIPGQNGAFAAAILTGDRSAIDPAVTERLRASNLAHLLAISGLHMGLLTGFVFAFIRYGLALAPAIALRFPAKKLGALGALLAGACYLMLSGGNVATQRAFIMASVVLVAVLLDRPAFTLRSIALAALVILVWRPESLTGAGFQMSFAATTGLVATFEWLRDRRWWRRTGEGGRRLLRPFLVVLISSFVAGTATAPFSAFHFNQISSYGLLANLIAVPAMGTIVMPSAVLALVAWPFGAEDIPLWFLAQGVSVILRVAETFASLPGATRMIPAGDALTLPLLAYGGLILVLVRTRARMAGMALISAALALWALSERPDVLISDGARLVGVRQAGGGRSLNRKRGDGFAARTWLRRDGDAASQADAWLRDGLLGSGNVVTAELPGGWRLVFVGKPVPQDELAALCRKNVLVVSRSQRRGAPGDCSFVGIRAAAEMGAMSVRVRDGELMLRGARGPGWRRLWTARR
ncbi:MAG: ComEC/Rec2 family competence protein [Paracoccaceae bacterium]